MRPNNCKLEEYEAWFDEQCTQLVIESGSILVGPFVEALGEPDSAPWTSDLAIIYEDSKYLRITEDYRQLPKNFKGGGHGAFADFAYHYGPCTAKRDSDGFPKFSKRVDLRIDRDNRFKNHIHYMKEDHIPEARLPGLDFATVDPFAFIKAVESHRKNGKPLHIIMGFTVEPSK